MILTFLFSIGYDKFEFPARKKNKSLLESNPALQQFWQAPYKKAVFRPPCLFLAFLLLLLLAFSGISWLLCFGISSANSYFREETIALGQFSEHFTYSVKITTNYRDLYQL